MNSILNEYGVLGSLLIDPSLFPEAAELPDDMFSSVPLQEIFRAMRHQYEESGSFDALTVRVEAGRNCTDVTDKLIAGLMDTTPTTANLDVYLAAVKEAALARSLRKIGEELMTAEHDPTDALGRAQEALQRLAEENTRGDSQTLTAVLMQLGYRVSEQVGGRVPCVASGLLRFDKLLGGGFINGGLHVIGARPAVGKSALALQIALNAARNGVKVLYLSLEMSAEDCSARLVGNIGGLSSARLMFGGRLTDNEYTRFAEGTTALSALPLVFNKRTGMNVRQVEALAYPDPHRVWALFPSVLLHRPGPDPAGVLRRGRHQLRRESLFEKLYRRLHGGCGHCPGLPHFLRFYVQRDAGGRYDPLRRHHELAVHRGNDLQYACPRWTGEGRRAHCQGDVRTVRICRNASQFETH